MLALPPKARSKSAPLPRIASEVIRQHAELVAFLWAQRDTLLAEDPPDLELTEEIGQRIEVNLDGLRIAGPAAWPLIAAQHEDFPEKGELFAFAWIAIELSEQEHIAQAVEFGRATEDDARGLVGALAWHRAESIGPFVRDWIGAQDAFKRFLGVSACVEHSVDPKQLLTRLVRDPDARVRAQSLRLAGKLKRADLVDELQNGLDDKHETARFWAAWALTELGSGDLAKKELQKIVAAGGPDALIALRALVSAGPDQEIRAWMGGLMKSPKAAPLAVRGIGMLGDRTALPWLIERMREPALATAAGAAFLELFPEARSEDDLFTTDPSEVDQNLADYLGDNGPAIPLVDKIEAWKSAKLLAQI